MPNRFGLADPPIGTDGKIAAHDHSGIGPSDGLLRHIDPDHHAPFDENLGRRRLSTMAFQESSDGSGMSVDIEKLLEVDNCPQTEHLPGQSWGMVRLPTAFCRGLGLQVGYYPVPSNDHHGAAWGIKTRGTRKQLRDQAEQQWIKRIPGVD